jgi:G6PDH family F420-dependent oxidoreductase
LDERILGQRWPEAEERLDMLEEAVHVIRRLWQGGVQSHRGRYHTVENARIYDLPDEPPPILISGFGPRSTQLAARVGDGFCTVSPVADAVKSFREAAGADKLVCGALSLRSASTRTPSARATAQRLWPNESLPGELSQILLRQRGAASLP